MNIIFFILLIFIFYSINGYIHEYIYIQLHVTESYTITLIQFFTMSCSFIFIKMLKTYNIKKYNIKIVVIFILCGVIQVLSKSFVNIASLKLSYSTEIVIRSCKIVPVVIFNIIVFRKVPNFYIIISTIFMGLGTCGMAITDIQMKNIFSYSGLVYGIIALILDSTVCNIESLLFDEIQISEIELIAYEYTTGSILMLMFEIINKEYLLLVEKILDNYYILLYILLFCISGILAIYFSLLCTKQYGIITTVMVTSSRKFMGIILSFLLFKNKVFSVNHAFSLVFIVSGSFIYIMYKYNK